MLVRPDEGQSNSGRNVANKKSCAGAEGERGILNIPCMSRIDPKTAVFAAITFTSAPFRKNWDSHGEA